MQEYHRFFSFCITDATVKHFLILVRQYFLPVLHVVCRIFLLIFFFHADEESLMKTGVKDDERDAVHVDDGFKEDDEFLAHDALVHEKF